MRNDENRSPNEQKEAIIEKQDQQIAHLKEQIMKLQNQHYRVRAESSLQMAELKKKLDNTRKKAALLQQKIEEIRNIQANIQNEEIANEIIENIWTILINYRKELFQKEEEYVPPPKIKKVSKTRKQAQDTPAPFDSPDIADIMGTPTTPSIQETQAFDSIASRRTRRKSTKNVCYKEPTLKEMLSPGSAYAFSIEDGMGTPTLPPNYTRDTPASTRKKRRTRSQAFV
ncbi:hypothetical protein GPJ56_004239 [Histomonas meleagridis]|uniref:uncharacterized protein n=1 Tax=Histomonas meleagridis TaxID=135588 RepID=UPI003559DB08|nr:hypothetical protein GPJ56_004239 [Histomonas meleagridis]KAH0802212.1 hypothetical protein GO595_004825 [Histomonas meleagridis]